MSPTVNTYPNASTQNTKPLKKWSVSAYILFITISIMKALSFSMMVTPAYKPPEIVFIMYRRSY